MEGKTVLYDKNRENDLVMMIAAEVSFAPHTPFFLLSILRPQFAALKPVFHSIVGEMQTLSLQV